MQAMNQASTTYAKRGLDNLARTCLLIALLAMGGGNARGGTGNSGSPAVDISRAVLVNTLSHLSLRTAETPSHDANNDHSHLIDLVPKAYGRDLTKKAWDGLFELLHSGLSLMQKGYSSFLNGVPYLLVGGGLGRFIAQKMKRDKVRYFFGASASLAAIHALVE